jgi:hypothetical protein
MPFRTNKRKMRTFKKRRYSGKRGSSGKITSGKRGSYRLRRRTIRRKRGGMKRLFRFSPNYSIENFKNSSSFFEQMNADKSGGKLFYNHLFGPNEASKIKFKFQFDTRLRVMSQNMFYFSTKNSDLVNRFNPKMSFDYINLLLRHNDLDVLCLQEFLYPTQILNQEARIKYILSRGEIKLYNKEIEIMEREEGLRKMGIKNIEDLTVRNIGKNTFFSLKRNGGSNFGPDIYIPFLYNRVFEYFDPEREETVSPPVAEFNDSHPKFVDDFGKFLSKLDTLGYYFLQSCGRVCSWSEYDFGNAIIVKKSIVEMIDGLPFLNAKEEDPNYFKKICHYEDKDTDNFMCHSTSPLDYSNPDIEGQKGETESRVISGLKIKKGGKEYVVFNTHLTESTGKMFTKPIPDSPREQRQEWAKIIYVYHANIFLKALDLQVRMLAEFLFKTQFFGGTSRSIFCGDMNRINFTQMPPTLSKILSNTEYKNGGALYEQVGKWFKKEICDEFYEMLQHVFPKSIHSKAKTDKKYLPTHGQSLGNIDTINFTSDLDITENYGTHVPFGEDKLSILSDHLGIYVEFK